VKPDSNDSADMHDISGLNEDFEVSSRRLLIEWFMLSIRRVKEGPQKRGRSTLGIVSSQEFWAEISPRHELRNLILPSTTIGDFSMPRILSPRWPIAAVGLTKKDDRRAHSAPN
jgi:hypothetical protein